MPTMSYLNLGQAPLPLETVYALTGGAPDMLAVDFVNNRALRRDSATPANNFNGALSRTGITDTHAGTINADDAAGAYSAFAANVLVRTSRGLQAAPTRTQGLTNPIALAGLGWNASPNTTVTDNQPGAPDGTSTVSRLQHLASSSTSLVQTITGTAATYTASIFYRRRAGSAANTFRLGLQTAGPVGSDNTNSVLLTATDEWQRGSYSATLVAGNCYFVLDNADNSTATDVEVWCAQVEPGAFAGPPILSKTTVNGNQQVIAGIAAPTTEAGLAVINLRGSADTNVLWSRNGGTASEWIGLIRDGANLDFRVIDDGVTVADLNLGTLPVGRFGFAYTVGAGYARAQIVSGATVAALAPASFPTVTQWAAGDGYSAARNAYLNTERMALAAGVTANDATFAAWLARAASALAA